MLKTDGNKSIEIRLSKNVEGKKMAVTLKATQRENLTLSATKKVRSTGGIPAIVYGKGEEAIPVSVDYLELMKTVRDEGRQDRKSTRLNSNHVSISYDVFC